MQLSRDSAAGLICLALSLCMLVPYARTAAVRAGADRAGFLPAHRARHHRCSERAPDRDRRAVDAPQTRQSRKQPRHPRQPRPSNYKLVRPYVHGLRALCRAAALARLPHLDVSVRRGTAAVLERPRSLRAWIIVFIIAAATSARHFRRVRGLSASAAAARHAGPGSRPCTNTSQLQSSASCI